MEGVSPILILGIGNELLCDDGIAIKIVNELREKIKLPYIHFLTLACGGLAIAEEISQYNEVIIIDAIKTRNGIPGTLYHLTPETFINTLHTSSFHDVSFLTALEFIKYIGLPVPKRIEILAIEIVEDMEFSDNFSEIISKNYPTLHQCIEKEVMNICQITDLTKAGLTFGFL